MGDDYGSDLDFVIWTGVLLLGFFLIVGIVEFIMERVASDETHRP